MAGSEGNNNHGQENEADAGHAQARQDPSLGKTAWSAQRAAGPYAACPQGAARAHPAGDHARPARRLDIPGAELEGLHYLRWLDNSEAIRSAAAKAKHAAHAATKPSRPAHPAHP